MSQPPDNPKKRPAKAGGRPQRPHLGVGARLLLAGIGIFLAIVVVGLFELGLRVAGYGPDLRLFVPVKVAGKDYLELNRDISLRFFPKEMAKPPGFERFSATRQPGEYRVFSLGESSTQGDPYGPHASFSAFFEAMLRDLHPDRVIDVINCGVVAISSADVLDMLPEILRQKPDALLVYVGHNEAYGADGVLSGLRGTITNRNWMKLRIRARNSRVGILVREIMAKARPKPAGTPAGFGMETMQGKVLPRESKLHRQMLDIYRGNLDELIRRAHGQGVDVILCTLAGNLRDQSPLGSAGSVNLPAAQKSSFEQSLNAARGAMDGGNLSAARPALEGAVEADSAFAEARFRLARCLDPRRFPGQPPLDPMIDPEGFDPRATFATPEMDAASAAAAAKHYRGALDHDIVHFRACSDQIAVIRELAREHQGPRLVLVDLDRDLAQASPDGIPGREFFTEHVHPYTRSNAFLADRICRAMAGSGPGQKLGSWDLSRLRSTDDYLKHLELTEVDEAAGLLVTLQHKMIKWPFTQAYENQAAMDYIQGQIRMLAQRLEPLEAQVLADIQSGRFLTGFDYGLRHQEIARPE